MSPTDFWLHFGVGGFQTLLIDEAIAEAQYILGLLSWLKILIF